MAQRKLVVIVLFALVLLAPLAGCRRPKLQKVEAEPAPEERNPLKPKADDAMPQNDVQRGVHKRLMENVLRQIGVLYNAYYAEFSRPPATVEVFKDYIRRDARDEILAIESGRVVFVPNLRPSSHALLAYEKDMYEKWKNRVVVFSDGHVETLEETDFQAALKGGR